MTKETVALGVMVHRQWQCRFMEGAFGGWEGVWCQPVWTRIGNDLTLFEMKERKHWT